MVVEVGKRALRNVGFGRSQKPHFGTAHARCGANGIDMHDAIAMFKPRAVFGIVAPDGQFKPFRQGIDDRHTHAVQPAGDFVGVATVIRVVEFATRMQLGHDDLSCRHALFLMDVDRDATAIVTHRYTVIGMDFYAHGSGVPGQGFVNTVIHDLIHHMVQARPIVGIANIHPGALAHRL